MNVTFINQSTGEKLPEKTVMQLQENVVKYAQQVIKDYNLETQKFCDWISRHIRIMQYKKEHPQKIKFSNQE